jgi:hypothetical protein
MRLTILLAALLALCLVACGDDSPTKPGGSSGGPAEFEDVPPIPRPTSPGGNVPAQSETWTAVSSGTLRDFAPRIVDLSYVSGLVEPRPTEGCSWQTLENLGPVTPATISGGPRRSRPELYLHPVRGGGPECAASRRPPGRARRGRVGGHPVPRGAHRNHQQISVHRPARLRPDDRDARPRVGRFPPPAPGSFLAPAPARGRSRRRSRRNSRGRSR